MPRERNPADKQARILNAAEEILNAGGSFDRFSLEEVARKAGVSKGGLLHHFPSKDTLLRAAAMRQADRFEQLFQSNLEQEIKNRPGRRLRAYIRAGLAPNKNLNPLLLSYLRNHSEEESTEESRFEVWHNQLADDGVDSETVSLVRMAVDGVLYTEMIDGQPIEGKIRESLLNRLLKMAEGLKETI